MGGILKSVFGGGGSKQSSVSDNSAFSQLQGLLSGNIGQGNSAMSQIGNILGLGGPGAGSAGLNNYLNSTGYDAQLGAGQDAITGSAAAKGLLQSGSTAKALTGFGQNLMQSKLGDYMGQLTGLGNYGLQSAQTLAGAGQKSVSSGSSSQHTGIINSLFGSDRRLKRDITLLRRAPSGLGVYSYAYKDEPNVTRIGVMADEVARILPEALGPIINGFASVYYDRLKEAA